MTASLLAKSAQGATSLIILQVASRALTFIVNQVLLRFLSPQILGVATQLELFSVSTLYFSRESIRVALQRGRSKDEGVENKKSDDQDSSSCDRRNIQEAVNLSYIAIALGLGLTLTFQFLYLRKADLEVLSTPYIHKSLNLYAIATILELLHEPYFAAAQSQLQYGIRTSSEMQATFVRCVTTCATAIWASKNNLDLGVLPFAIGQLIYSITLLLSYSLRLAPTFSHTSTTPYLHKPSPSSPLIAPTRLKLASTLYAQSLFKQLLTSGDSYLITLFTTLSSQGAYALASNYGGLLARILFQPIEESSRTLFARLLSPSTNTEEYHANIKRAITYLTTVVHAYSLLSLLLTTLAPPLVPALLSIIAGDRWTSTTAPSVLAAYCYYIPFLALNGLLEAYISAVATPAELRLQSLWMVAFSLFFATTGYAVLGVYEMGAQGLVLANAIVGAGRTAWSAWFAWRDLHERGLEVGRVDLVGVLPRPLSVLVAVLGTRVLGKALEGQNGLGDAQGMVKVVGVVGGCGVLLLGCEWRFIREVWGMAGPEKSREEKQEESPVQESGAKEDGLDMEAILLSIQQPSQ